MRIIAKHRDYYDSALAFGHDDHVVFSRVKLCYEHGQPDTWPRELDIMHPAMYSQGFVQDWCTAGYTTNKKGMEFRFSSFTVAFCGKLYPGIKIQKKTPRIWEWESWFYYDFDSYAAALDEHGLTFRDDRKTGWLRHYRAHEGNSGRPLKRPDCEVYFSTSGADHITLFAEHGWPIVVWDHDDQGENRVTLNDNLEQHAFYKVFDAYSAFQELDMFIGGVMARDDSAAMANISDEDMKAQKGFFEWSFKTPPTKKR